MMDAAVKIVAESGFEGFTTKRWASTAGVAEGTLYYHFKSKDDLLMQTFTFIDEQLAAFLVQCMEKEEAGDLREFVHRLWTACFHFLLNNHEKTLYYYRYKSSTRYSEAQQRKQLLSYTTFREKVHSRIAPDVNRTPEETDIIWTYILDSSHAFAFRMITGGIAKNETNIETILHYLENGVFSVFSEK